MPDQQVRVDVVRSGGFAGMTRTATADTDALDEDAAAMLRRIVDESQLLTRPTSAARSAGRPDGFQYDVTITRGPERRSVVLHDPLSGADRQLVRWVLTAGRNPPR